MSRVKNTDYDVVFIGAGHNGLVAAWYLLKAGLKVGLYERRAVAGGAAVTEEFHPGFKNSVAAYTISLLNPKIIKDMKLAFYGLEIVERKMANFWPQPDGGVLFRHNDFADNKAEFARFSARDAEVYEAYSEMIERAADFLREMILKTPPNAGGGISALIAAAGLGRRFSVLKIDQQRVILDLFTKSAKDILDGWFESDVIKGALAFDSIVGFYGSPETPGSAYVLLHHAFGEVNGKKGAWGHAIGGMGAITQAMAKAVIEAGGEIMLGSPVAEVLVEKARATGVRLDSGETVRARAVASNLNPKLLLTRFVAAEHLSEGLPERMAGYKCGSGTFRMNVALSALPNFSCLKGHDPEKVRKAMTAGIIIGPTMDYLDRAFYHAKRHGWSKKPIIEMLVPSTLDSTLAPEGAHVASLFCQQFAPVLPDGKSWDEEREHAADHIIDCVEDYAPGFRASILGRQILSPLDLENIFGLTGGDIMHGELSLSQMFSARPLIGLADYRMPVKGLYLVGSGAHPGGGVTGAPGHNAAREIVKDFKRHKI